jgi:hypothetical protein
MHRWTSLVLATTVFVACESTGRETKPTSAAPMSEEEMMKKMTELGTPGPGQKKLEPLVGTFKVTAHMWNDASAPETTSEGTSVGEWIFDGRYVKTKFDGNMMGAPFTGHGLTGFDNSSGKYQSFWVDSMSTGMMPIAAGTMDASGKVLTSTRTYFDPLFAKTITTREVYTFVDADHHTFEWFQPGADGKEFRMMKLDYVRQK